MLAEITKIHNVHDIKAEKLKKLTAQADICPRAQTSTRGIFASVYVNITNSLSYPTRPLSAQLGKRRLAINECRVYTYVFVFALAYACAHSNQIKVELRESFACASEL